MIVIVSNKRDITSDYIVSELRRRGLEYFRLNSEDITSYRITFSARERDDWVIEDGKTVVKGRDVTAAYFRRPGDPDVSHFDDDEGISRYISKEWQGVLKNLYFRLQGKWLNSPFSIMLAEDKSRQLLEAVQLGFDIPKGVITNNKASAKFVFDGSNNVIGKTISHSLVEGVNEKVLFTSRMGSFDSIGESSLEMAPVIVQEELDKDVDLRITVVGEKVFPVAIFSQKSQGTETDWRRGTGFDLEQKSFELPLGISKKCVAIVRSLDLLFGAVDMVLDKCGRYWFLEVNPNGQWAWMENRLGLPISKAIVDELESR